MTLNVVISGASAVGKATISKRLVDPNIKEQSALAVVSKVNFAMKICRVQDLLMLLNGGKNVFKSSDYLLLIYDITSRDSFNELDNYWNEFLSYGTLGTGISWAKRAADNEFPVVLISNKNDLSDERAVSIEEVRTWCEAKRPKNPISYMECCALAGRGIPELLTSMLQTAFSETAPVPGGAGSSNVGISTPRSPGSPAKAAGSPAIAMPPAPPDSPYSSSMLSPLTSPPVALDSGITDERRRLMTPPVSPGQRLVTNLHAVYQCPSFSLSFPHSFLLLSCPSLPTLRSFLQWYHHVQQQYPQSDHDIDPQSHDAFSRSVRCVVGIPQRWVEPQHQQQQ